MSASASPSTEPVPILKRSAENRVMRELKNVALKGCDEEVRAFAACAEGKLLSVIWHCRALSKAVDQCLDRYSKDEVLKDEMRREHGRKFPKAVTGYTAASSSECEGDKEAPL